MITMRFTNNWQETLINPVKEYGNFFETVHHSPGTLLGPNGVTDYLQVEQSHFGMILDVGELPLQVYEQPDNPEWFVILASGPFKLLGESWDDPTWMYWIGSGSWPAPGTPEWTIGTSGTTNVAWGPLTVNMSPSLGDDIVIQTDFDPTHAR